MIVEDPHEALYTVSHPVTEEEFKDVVRLAAKALAHLKKTKTGVGLAANQVGDLRRWFVGQRFKIVINPEILEISDETETLEEGCLSKPGFKCMRERAIRIKVRWTSHKGKVMNRTLHGMSARIFQHELDHLNGINIFGRGSLLKNENT